MKISPEVLEVLNASKLEGQKLFLPPEQLPRDLYMAVDKVLKAMGGKWNRSAKAHLFDRNPSDVLENAIQTESVVDPRKELQFFPTPKEVVSTLIELADIKPGNTLLEPSAGDGAILERLLTADNECVAVEKDVRLFAKLKERFEKAEAWKDLSLHHADFLEWESTKFDRVVMNPPFSRQQDIDHVLHAYMVKLAPGGVLVAVMSEGTFFRENAKAREFREVFKQAGGVYEALPAGAFAQSGTNVRTRIVRMQRY